MGKYEEALLEILSRIADKIPEGHKEYPVKAYIAGGVAVYLYTQARVSDDIDMHIYNKIEDFPQDLYITWNDNGEERKLAYDYTYHEGFGLKHEDFDKRLNHYKTIDNKFEIYLLHPLDLIISKIARFEENDEADIKELIAKCNVDKDQLYNLADDAIKVAFGVKEKDMRQHLEWTMEFF
ncbi:DUF6036 family nucleotidyltransferase [Sulfurimonas sp.]|uniref:DUF6036 family nucleotidyltransferase n=1 Tax=Sulfurimonas sp. TaxID=2022749 RepID=UPI003D146DBA